MKVSELELSGLYLIELKKFEDPRGFFMERFREDVFKEAGLPFHYPQENHSRSAPGVIRALHYQVSPAQGKLVGAVRGRVWDVVVDIRQESKTFGKSLATELSDRNGLLLWIPAGFAHGICVLGDEPADVIYKVTDYYNPKTEGGIRWDDPELAIEWPVKKPVISDRDRALPSFAEYRKNPVNWPLPTEKR